MPLEIERKYLVENSGYKTMATGSKFISQGYLNTDPERTVRIRTYGDHGFITVKSKNSGSTRHEWEYEIPYPDAVEMLALCNNVIEKRRWIVPYAGHCWEVDEYGGHLHGLVVAEVELESEDKAVDLPDFAGREVTGDVRYYNSSLSTCRQIPQ